MYMTYQFVSHINLRKFIVSSYHDTELGKDKMFLSAVAFHLPGRAKMPQLRFNAQALCMSLFIPTWLCTELLLCFTYIDTPTLPTRTRVKLFLCANKKMSIKTGERKHTKCLHLKI